MTAKVNVLIQCNGFFHVEDASNKEDKRNNTHCSSEHVYWASLELGEWPVLPHGWSRDGEGLHFCKSCTIRNIGEAKNPRTIGAKTMSFDEEPESGLHGECQREIDLLMSDVKSRDERIIRIEEVVDDGQRICREWEIKYDALRAEVEELKFQANTREIHIADLEAKVIVLKEQVKLDDEESENLRSEVKRLEEEIQKVNAERDCLRLDLQNANEDRRQAVEAERERCAFHVEHQVSRNDEMFNTMQRIAHEFRAEVKESNSESNREIDACLVRDYDREFRKAVE